MSSNENEKDIHSNNELHHDRNISDAVIKRLPRYYRYLRELMRVLPCDKSSRR